MKKSLPLHSIPIKSLQYHAFLFAILNDDDNKKNYLINNYQLLTVRNIKYPHLDFFHNEITGNSSCVKKYIISNKVNNIINTIREALLNDFYVILNINEYYLHNRTAFMQNYYRHDIMIFGFDDNQRRLFTIGYNKSNKFCPDVNSFDEIQAGYESLQSDWDYEITLVMPQCVEYTINKEKIFKDLKIQCYGSDPFNNFDSLLSNRSKIEVSGRNCYGLKCYDFLKTELLKYKENVDMRSFEVLYEHFKILNHTLKSMHFSITNDLEKQIYKCKLLALKYNLTYNKALIFEINNRLSHIKDCEHALIKSIIDN